MMFIPNLLSTESGSEGIVRARIVIVEDEPDLRTRLPNISAPPVMMWRPRNRAAARSLIETQAFHLAILDIAMPGEDGLSLGRWLRSKMPIGIIYATAAGTALDRIVGLELGADDYIVKPYELREVLARVRSVLRRVPQPTELLDRKARTDRRSVAFGPFRPILTAGWSLAPTAR